MVTGPGGIGKTRLAEEIAVRARRRKVRVAIGRCWRDGEAPPLWPWRTILRELDAPAGLLAELQAETVQDRFARFAAVLDHLQTAPHGTSSLIVLDDVHMADPVTLLLARFLARERPGLRLLLLLTRRDYTEEMPTEVRELLAELDRSATTISLAGLGDSAVSSYLSACGYPELSPELLSTVGAITKGNPLHLRGVVESCEFGDGKVLPGLGQVIACTIDQLSDLDRQVVGLAALIGLDVLAYEVARVAELSPAVAAASLARAVGIGLMVERPNAHLAFVHERIREAALASLAPTERLTAHARAATLFAGTDPERVLRRAHHAFVAAQRSTEDAALAVQIAREAAVTLQTADGFEQAATLLGRAVELHDAAALSGPAAALMVEWAEAVLACGRLAQARPLFHRAARMADAEGDPMILARAALGLGGVWVREHRLVEEAERVTGLQRRALGALPQEAIVLRTRLTVRLAAEEAYRGGPVMAVLEGVDAARCTGDDRALAEALSLCHHALLAPEYAQRRLDVADELITVAATAGDGWLSLIGLCWRTVDLFLLGDPSAGMALAELRLRADTLGCHSILFIVRAIEVMLTIRAGQFPQAEEAASACLALGTEVGDADALAYYGAHLAAIRMFQGREAELADLAASIATSPALTERDRAFSSAAALFALRAGRPESARALLAGLRQEGVGTIPSSSSWLLTMFAVVELAAALNDRATAHAVYEALLPYAELPSMASLAIVCFGSVQRPLGVAALTCGKLDLAIEHFASAVAASERLGHRPAAIQARAELALAHIRRACDGDVRRGHRLMRQAVAEAEALGMTGLVARWRDALATAAATQPETECDLVSMSSVPHGRWRVALGSHIATVSDLVGMRYLARLIAEPNRDIPALALICDHVGAPLTAEKHTLMDLTGIKTLRARVRDLRQQPVLSAAEQDELEALTHELARVSGLGGRIRSFADVPERARTAVRKAIKRALEQLSAANPVVGQYLERRIETGAVCRYRGESGANV
jgi:hypothetical protein